MTKQEILEAIKLLSAMESWAFSTQQRLPDHTLEQLNEVMETLEREVLK